MFFPVLIAGLFVAGVGVGVWLWYQVVEHRRAMRLGMRPDDWEPESGLFV